ncbi:MAG: hypothetical protein HFG55_05750 [Lachnospiraceae bacterium]|nr:hypothetical protein [Lachnospiraceae bacterium]
MRDEFEYTIEKESVRIDKVRQPGTMVVIPENIEGYPVIELGAYALAGSMVEELHLPVQLRKIGAYGFYNCERLRRIFCGSRTVDLGAGLFAGAGGVEFLDFTLFEGEKSCFKELLSELRQTLRVRIHLPGSGTKQKGAIMGENAAAEARLIFPEYFEESVENTPARILYIETHGCGHRYRYCFSGTQFQYQSYDELFPHVKVQEPEALVAELALGRLQYPYGLTEKNERMYREYVIKHWQMAATLMLEADMHRGKAAGNLDPGGISWLVKEILEYGQNISIDERSSLAEKLPELIRMAQQAGDTEAVAWLMDFQHQKNSPKRKRFEL